MDKTNRNFPANLVIRPFEPTDQDEIRRLVLKGLEEHWGILDATLNRDLEDIGGYYGQRDMLFLVAEMEGEIVGCGALIPELEGIGRIVRMSVAACARRRGIGRVILQHLLRAARCRGYRRVVLETTATWQDAVSFYQSNGFRTTGFADGNRHFALDLE